VEGDAAECGGDRAGWILLDCGGRSSLSREILVDMVKAMVDVHKFSSKRNYELALLKPRDLNSFFGYCSSLNTIDFLGH